MVVILFSFYYLLSAPTLIINVLFCYPCRNPLFGFDGAKLRRFSGVTKHLCEIVCANSRFFDVCQIIGVYLNFSCFYHKNVVFSMLFRAIEPRPKVLPLGKSQINLHFHSLIRTFAVAIYII